MSKYQLCKSKLHRPLEKWNLNFHFRKPDIGKGAYGKYAPFVVKYNERKRARNVLARSWRTARQASDVSHENDRQEERT